MTCSPPRAARVQRRRGSPPCSRSARGCSAHWCKCVTRRPWRMRRPEFLGGHMPKSQLFGFCTVTGLAGAVLLALLPVRSPAADAPPAPVTPAPAPAPAPQPPRPANNADVDAQLQAAQQRLEQAAHDVARLSTQLSSTLIEEMMPATGARVIIGVQLEPLSGKAGARVGD